MTVQAAATWMAEEAVRSGVLYQDQAMSTIIQIDAELVVLNTNGNQAIRKDVLAAFNKLTPDFVWSRGGRYWRRREEFDLPSRQQP